MLIPCMYILICYLLVDHAPPQPIKQRYSVLPVHGGKSLSTPSFHRHQSRVRNYSDAIHSHPSICQHLFILEHLLITLIIHQHTL
jgi:hypothetical protein